MPFASPNSGKTYAVANKNEIKLHVGAVVIDVNELDPMLDFWKAVLAYDIEVRQENDWAKLADPEDKGVTVSLQVVPEKRSEKNRLHLDLYATDPKEEVKRIIDLGATFVRAPEQDEDFTVLADPEGNLFCVIDKSAT